MSDLQQQLSTDAALRLLVKQQRRRILRRVAETTDGTTVDQLEAHLADADSRSVNGRGPTDQRFVELHHIQLPVLEDSDVIVYDVPERCVRRGTNFQAAHSLLETVDKHREDPSVNLV
ncbi:DUF7344 domain-containing protein [Salarchaeum japonicum]|uniref:DUF7344 domain-containing protein n=1 Tax=Salarchaeum japonicum TaxID=555573 RepID=UPI003C75C0A0